MPAQPTKVTIRMFNVGFGDCFLLTFHYEQPLADQHILIDFGTVGGKADMKGVANDIKAACGGKLYAVVATHRHKDHISGFSDAGGKDSTGAIIRSCRPEVVLQPWTEHPDAAAKHAVPRVVQENGRPHARRGAGVPGDGVAIEASAEEFPFDVDHRKGEAAAQHAGQQARMADDQPHELHGGVCRDEGIGGADDDDIGKGCHHDGVEAQQHRDLGIERGQHAVEAVPRHYPGLLLGRSLAGLDAGDPESLLRHFHERSALMLAA
jgi:hypothetical protein